MSWHVGTPHGDWGPFWCEMPRSSHPCMSWHAWLGSSDQLRMDVDGPSCMWKMFCNVFKTPTQYYIHYVYIYSNLLIYIYAYIYMHIIFPIFAYLYKYTMVSGVFRMNGGRAYSECLVWQWPTTRNSCDLQANMRMPRKKNMCCLSQY